MKEKRFIKKAEYPGGSYALKKFIKDNLRYPKRAILRKIEGKVLLKYEVSNDGVIHNVDIVKGLGNGCDREAKRLVNLLRYGSLNNKGIRVNTKFRLTINFKLPSKKEVKINYIYTQSKNTK